MSMSFRFKSGVLQAGLIVNALGALLAFTSSAQAQLPSVVAYGNRFFFTQPSTCTGTPGNISRDSAGDVFVLIAASKCILEFPVSGPLQPAVLSTDASMSTTPAFIATDGAGDLFVTHTTTAVQKIPRSGTTYSTSETTYTASGLTNNYAALSGAAVDALGNVYMSTSSGNTVGSWKGTGILVVGPSAPNGKYFFENTAGVYGVAFDAAGDLFYTDNTSVYEISAATVANTIDGTTPLPTGAGTVIGNYATSAGCPGCANIATPKTLFFDNAGNLYVGSGSTFYIIVNNGGLSATSTTYTVPASLSAYSGNMYGAVDNQGNFYIDYGTSLEFYGGSKIRGYGPTYAVGASSATLPSSGYTFGLLFTATTTLSATTPFVNSAYSAAYGAASSPSGIYDTADTTGLYCIAGTTYTAGQTCEVEAGYHAYQPGALSGSVNVIGGSSSSSTNLLASLIVEGTVTGPLAAVDTGNKILKGVGYGVTTGYTSPAGVSIDNTGAMYMADAANNAVYKYPANATSTTTPSLTFTGLSSPSGTAVDQAGNLYVVNTGANNVLYYTNNNGTLSSTPATLSLGSYTLSSPHGIAIDNLGDIYIADTGNSRVLLAPNPFAAAVGQVVPVGSGFTSPYGVAIDNLNDVFVADKGAGKVYEVPGGYGFVTVTTSPGASSTVSIGSSFSQPTSIAVDASGTLYITDAGLAEVLKLAQVSGAYGTPTVLFNEASGGIARPYGIAVDLTGDLYITDSDLPALYYVPRSTGTGGSVGTLAFGNVAMNATNTLYATLSNAGYSTALTNSLSTSPATPYALGTNGCGSSLATGASCNVSVTFTGPTTTDTQQAGNMVFTTNQDGGTNITAKVPFSGESTGAVSSVTITGDSSVVYGATESYSVQALDAAGNPSAAAPSSATINISGPSSSNPSVSLSNGVGSFILPSLGVGAYSLTTTISGVAVTSPQSVTITKAPLVATPASASRLFDAVDPSFAYSFVGLQTRRLPLQPAYRLPRATPSR
jgi:sugar lactone lactonase YvrE